MTVNSAGSSASVQSAMLALRQSMQMEQVAAAVVTAGAAQVTGQASQQPPSEDSSERPHEGRGGKINVKA